MESELFSAVVCEEVHKDDVELEDVGENGDTNSDNTQTQGLLADRLKRKAKRPSTAFTKELNDNGTTVNGTVFRQIKNSRKPRNGFGRGLPKKEHPVDSLFPRLF